MKKDSYFNLNSTIDECHKYNLEILSHHMTHTIHENSDDQIHTQNIRRSREIYIETTNNQINTNLDHHIEHQNKKNEPINYNWINDNKTSIITTDIKNSDKNNRYHITNHKCNIESYNHLKFHQLLSISSCDIKKLSELSWNGIPWCIRGKIWRMLTGYIPTKIEDQEETLSRKRLEYQNFVDQYFHYRNNHANDEYYRQITIDIPRTHPNMNLLHNNEIINLYKRILYIWAIRHPACGYVQGINDLIAPFLIVYLYEYVGENYDTKDISSLLPENKLNNIESDIFWTFSHLLDGIQDNYTPDQPGIQKRVRLLEKIISFSDKKLYQFLTDINVKFLQFGLRWMNNLLVREIPIECTIRLWDTYFAESNGFDKLHLFVCAAFLMKFSKVILRLQDFQEVSYFIQNLPTHTWNEDDIAILLAEAFQLQFLYSNVVERD